ARLSCYIWRPGKWERAHPSDTATSKGTENPENTFRIDIDEGIYWKLKHGPHELSFMEFTLQSDNWELFVNDAWILGGVDGGKHFLLLSRLSKNNLYAAGAKRMTVTGREAVGLQEVFKYTFKREAEDLLIHATPSDLSKHASALAYKQLMDTYPDPPNTNGQDKLNTFFRGLKPGLTIHARQHVLIDCQGSISFTTTNPAKQHQEEADKFERSVLLSLDQDPKTFGHEIKKLEDWEGQKLDLRGANLSGLSLNKLSPPSGGLNLHEADLSNADLEGANLAKADLRWADLTCVTANKHTSFEGAMLGGVDPQAIQHLEDQQANLKDIDTFNFDPAGWLRFDGKTTSLPLGELKGSLSELTIQAWVRPEALREMGVYRSMNVSPEGYRLKHDTYGLTMDCDYPFYLWEWVFLCQTLSGRDGYGQFRVYTGTTPSDLTCVKEYRWPTHDAFSNRSRGNQAVGITDCRNSFYGGIAHVALFYEERSLDQLRCDMVATDLSKEASIWLPLNEGSGNEVQNLGTQGGSFRIQGNPYWHRK
ncbi:pentapeptide repeat-containing protein, partial [Candidatus Entotheonella palauensis]|uniref:pentapeptide repeat-containing protein n=1 Tax=Candidatus Entotheonella palauensis TaxID=93172 RepID=UPI001C4E09F9